MDSDRSARRQDPRGAPRGQVGQPPLRREAGQPGQQAALRRSSWSAPGLAGASAAATLGELGYRVKVFTFHDSPRPRAQHRRAGRHQRGEELQERRRQRRRLFYDTIKGGDYRAPRGERLPARPDQRGHHRPVRRPGRAVRPRVRRPARQPLVRRRAGVAHVLRPRPDRASSCCSAPTRRSSARSASAR